MSKFKVGDRVEIKRQRDDLSEEEAQPGDAGVVEEVWEDRQTHVRIDRTDGVWYFDETDLRRIKSFRVGDRVEIKTNLGYAAKGAIGTVVEVDASDLQVPYRVDLDAGTKIWVCPFQIKRCKSKERIEIDVKVNGEVVQTIQVR